MSFSNSVWIKFNFFYFIYLLTTNQQLSYLFGTLSDHEKIMIFVYHPYYKSPCFVVYNFTPNKNYCIKKMHSNFYTHTTHILSFFQTIYYTHASERDWKLFSRKKKSKQRRHLQILVLLNLFLLPTYISKHYKYIVISIRNWHPNFAKSY